MLFLVDSYRTKPDNNGNPREIIRIVCTQANEVTNILWYDVDYRTIPTTTTVLSSTYGVTTRKHDKVVHVQSHNINPSTFATLLKKNVDK